MVIIKDCKIKEKDGKIIFYQKSYAINKRCLYFIVDKKEIQNLNKENCMDLYWKALDMLRETNSKYKDERLFNSAISEFHLYLFDFGIIENYKKQYL